jgi:flavorubredoxin/flavin reductase (DIM6/NTAB) family NADH-FMN oxidoreductase RutF
MVPLPVPGAPPDVLALVGSTPARLKVEVEYGLKRGTTDNCYLISSKNSTAGGGQASAVLIDVPDAAWAASFVPLVTAECGARAGVAWPTTLVLTHLTPKRWPALRALLAARAGLSGSDTSGATSPRPGTPPPPPCDVHLSNPALRLLRECLDTDPAGAALAGGLTLRVVRGGGDPASRAAGPGGRLELVPVPTPRWPDLLVAVDREARVAFTSKLFGAHVSPSVALAGGGSDGSGGGDGKGDAPTTRPTTAGDAPGGWAAYGPDWRHYYDCMLAPVASSAAAALGRLDLAPAPPVVVSEGFTSPSSSSSSSPSSTWAFLRSLDTRLAAAQRSKWGSIAVGSAAPPWSEAGTPVAVLCPLHGPTINSALTQLTRSYGAWTDAAADAAAGASVAILYASAYGNTAALAQALARGVTKAGVGAEAVNLETASLADAEAAVARAAGFAVGAPTLGGHMPTQVATALGAIIRAPGAAARLPAGVFGSFGWSGEAVDEMEGRLRDAGFRFAFPPIRVKFRPTAADMQAAEESGTDLAQAVLKARKKAQAGAVAAVAAGAAAEGAIRASASSLASNPALAALGRVVGSLCVVTARGEDGDTSTAMLASWVAQASFKPPGLTVAVKRDRAVEPFLTKGAPFVLNILASGKEKPVFKALSRTFAPGEDRFAGLEGVEACEAAGGAPILQGAAASFLVCSVSDRMDAGDHWIVYATVKDGKVVDPAAEAAVHHRKSGVAY